MVNQGDPGSPGESRKVQGEPKSKYRSWLRSDDFKSPGLERDLGFVELRRPEKAQGDPRLKCRSWLLSNGFKK